MGCFLRGFFGVCSGSVDLTRSASEASRHTSSRGGGPADSAEKLAKRMGDVLKKSTASLLDTAKQKAGAAKSEAPPPPEIKLTALKSVDSGDKSTTETAPGWADLFKIFNSPNCKLAVD